MLPKLPIYTFISSLLPFSLSYHKKSYFHRKYGLNLLKIHIFETFYSYINSIAIFTNYLLNVFYILVLLFFLLVYSIFDCMMFFVVLGVNNHV